SSANRWWAIYLADYCAARRDKGPVDRWAASAAEGDAREQEAEREYAAMVERRFRTADRAVDDEIGARGRTPWAGLMRDAGGQVGGGVLVEFANGLRSAFEYPSDEELADRWNRVRGATGEDGRLISAYETAMRAGEQEYAPVFDLLRSDGLAPSFTQTG